MNADSQRADSLDWDDSARDGHASVRFAALFRFNCNFHIYFSAFQYLKVLRFHFLISFSFFQLFLPLFIASALNFYFLVIVCVRTVMEDNSMKRALGWSVHTTFFSFLNSY